MQHMIIMTMLADVHFDLLVTDWTHFTRMQEKSKPDLSGGCREAPRLCGGLSAIQSHLSHEALLRQGCCWDGGEPPRDVHVEPQHYAGEDKNQYHGSLHLADTLCEVLPSTRQPHRVLIMTGLSHSHTSNMAQGCLRLCHSEALPPCCPTAMKHR